MTVQGNSTHQPPDTHRGEITAAARDGSDLSEQADDTNAQSAAHKLAAKYDRAYFEVVTEYDSEDRYAVARHRIRASDKVENELHPAADSAQDELMDGNDSAIVGRKLELQGVVYEVIGVDNKDGVATLRSADGKTITNETAELGQLIDEYEAKQQQAEQEGSESNYMAADYLLHGGMGVMGSTDYLLRALSGAFTRASSQIEAIRKKYFDQINTDNLGVMFHKVIPIIRQ